MKIRPGRWIALVLACLLAAGCRDKPDPPIKPIAPAAAPLAA